MLLLAIFTHNITSLHVLLDTMVTMGYNREDILRSLATKAYDEAYGTYLLLGAKSTRVCKTCYLLTHWDFLSKQQHLKQILLFI